MNPWIDCRRSIWLLLALGAYLPLIAACDFPARVTGMIPDSFETARQHPQTVRVIVTGGQESEAVGRPHIPNSAFAEAVVQSIDRSKTFAKVVDGQSQAADYLLTATLFALEKRIFGRALKLEIGWTLRRSDNSVVLWQESIVSEYTEGNVQVETQSLV